MGISALVVSCLLAKVDLVSIQAGAADAEVRASLTRALGEDKVVDASSVYGYLLEQPGPMSMQDFGAFADPPISGWPAPLKDTWTSGVAYCADIAGPPPWGGPNAHSSTLTSVWCCSQRLSEYLWQRYLDLAHPDRFIAAKIITGGMGLKLRVTTYAPGDDKQEVVEGSLSSTQSAAEIDAAIARLLSHQGTTQPRTVSHSLFVPLKSDPFVGKPAGGAVTGAKSCESAPSAVTIATPGPLGESVVASWSATSKGTAAPRSCELSFTEHLEPPRGVLPSLNVTTTTSVLRCGKDVVSAEVSRRMNPAPLEQSAKILVEKLALRWCR